MEVNLLRNDIVDYMNPNQNYLAEVEYIGAKETIKLINCKLKTINVSHPEIEMFRPVYKGLEVGLMYMWEKGRFKERENNEGILVS